MQLSTSSQREINKHSQKTEPRISTYTDFREYLSDWFEFKKTTASTRVRSYSYAAFSAAADIRSPNYLKLIIEGQRNLSDEMIRKFAKALGLSKSETDEFSALVHYGQAKDPLERNQRLRELADYRVNQRLRTGEIKAENWDRVPSWVTWVLHALTDQEGYNFDLGSLREMLRGRASLDEIKKALKRLIDAGDLVEDENGHIKKGRIMMEGASEIPGELVKKLQGELIYLGLESLFQDETAEREVGSVTMALTKDEFEHIKFELRALRKKLYRDILVKREQSKGERVYQLNMQLFPVTNPTPKN